MVARVVGFEVGDSARDGESVRVQAAGLVVVAGISGDFGQSEIDGRKVALVASVVGVEVGEAPTDGEGVGLKTAGLVVVAGNSTQVGQSDVGEG
ncbi:hypothetical protein [Candidatus Frankia alpina]|uniref:hypothetical protein n=1 Tax=Candidatus Frankia alpina TaxID=2699483 RepID=UPI0019681E0F|nr:hypothetical protein [Candidatus Frankia alpina]